MDTPSVEMRRACRRAPARPSPVPMASSRPRRPGNWPRWRCIGRTGYPCTAAEGWRYGPAMPPFCPPWTDDFSTVYSSTKPPSTIRPRSWATRRRRLWASRTSWTGPGSLWAATGSPSWAFWHRSNWRPKWTAQRSSALRSPRRTSDTTDTRAGSTYGRAPTAPPKWPDCSAAPRTPRVRSRPRSADPQTRCPPDWPWPDRPPRCCSGAGLLAAMAIGAISGLYPAMRAA